MKKPENPPNFRAELASDPTIYERLHPLMSFVGKERKYLPWDKLRRLPPPQGFTSKDWWMATKIRRIATASLLPLLDKTGQPFLLGTSGRIQELLHKIDLNSGGKINLPSGITNPQTRDQYLVNSLMQEAITSSQLEGAATTREVAKEMLLTGRKPRDNGEQMILNNYITMKRIREIRDQPLSEALVLSLHTSVTDKTLDKTEASGRYRLESEKIQVETEEKEVLHIPPPASELPSRMQAMCAFANGETPDYFLHPVVRAIVLHFWLAYDHPFVDGNGRTARALFYWSMLRHGYWLFEFISISEILRQARAQYPMSFLYTETDDNDLTYFVDYQTKVIDRATCALHDYIERKTQEAQASERLLKNLNSFNHRQITLLSHALRHPGQIYTIEGHQTSHAIVYETARKDLLTLAQNELLEEKKRGPMKIYRVPKDLQARIQAYDSEMKLRRELIRPRRKK